MSYKEIIKSNLNDSSLIEIKDKVMWELDDTLSCNWSIWADKKAIVASYPSDHMIHKLKSKGFVYSGKSNKCFLFLGE